MMTMLQKLSCMHLHLLVTFANVSFSIKLAKNDDQARNSNLCLSVNLAVCFVCLCLSVNLAVCFVCLFLLVLYEEYDQQLMSYWNGQLSWAHHSWPNIPEANYQYFVHISFSTYSQNALLESVEQLELPLKYFHDHSCLSHKEAKSATAKSESNH